MGILIPFPALNVRPKQGRAAVRAGASGEVVFFTGVRYERVQDEPKFPPSNSRQASSGGRRKRR